MYEKYPGNNGWDHAKIDFETEMKANVEGTPGVMHNGVSCTMCHDPVDMELRVKSKHLFEAFERREANIGEPNPLKDPSKTSKQDMRTLVCAQCHVEYHFEPVTFRVVLPWDEGLTFDAMYEYYEKERKREGGFVRDFEHGISKALILKAQHPEYEAWTTGIHGKNNVACADCHMPYLTKNGQKYSDHNITSPLRTSKHVEASCMTCHDQTEKELVGYVTDVQDIFWSQQNQAEKAVAEAHRMIEKAMAAGISDTAIGEARELVREAQWAWDYVAAENSMGFHFAEQGMKTTGHAIVKANEAIITLYKAAGGRL
jgi:nitrite reductase (cytochrome c-552)